MPSLRIASRALVAGLVASVAIATPAAAVGEYRTSTGSAGAGGHGWAPCSVIEMLPNSSGSPFGEAAFRAELGEAAAAVNAAVGRELLVVGPSTSLTAGQLNDLTDDSFVVSWNDLPGGTAGLAHSAWTGLGIIAADIELDPAIFAGLSREQRVGITMHEIGHALGLSHVGDSHEALANAFINDGDGVGPGTTEALRILYSGPNPGQPGCDDRPTIDQGPHDWDFPVEYGAAPGGITINTVAGAADSVISLGIHAAYTIRASRGSGWADLAIVCRDDVFADCLSGAALAGADGPIVFVPGGSGGSLPADVWGAIDSALSSAGTVYVLGGSGAVSPDIEASLRRSWPDTRRLAGPSRIETAVEVAREVVRRRGPTGTVLLARADDPADAVTGGAAAGARGLPILLTDRDQLHPATAAVLDEFNVDQTLLLGGGAAIADGVHSALGRLGRGPERIAGRTRSETSVAVAQHPVLWGRTSLPADVGFIGLNGYDQDMWALALSVAPIAAHEWAPILLTGWDAVPTTPAEGSWPGEPGWYLSHLTADPGVDRVTQHYWFVGVGHWADRHAQQSFISYLLLGFRSHSSGT